MTQPAGTMQSQDSLQGVGRLKDMLVDQVTQHEQMNQEMHARDLERWQLLQLLNQKDKELARQEEVASRQRATLVVARDAGRYFHALCVLRAWRDHVQRLSAERLLSKVKGRCAESALRHACGTLNVALRRPAARQLGQAWRTMWFHSSLQAQKAPGVISKVDDAQAKASALEKDVESILRRQPLASQRVLSNEPPDDQVLFDSPARDVQAGYDKFLDTSPLKASPRLKAWVQMTPRSDASTCATSSSSQSRVGSLASSQSRAASSASNPFAAARLALMLEAACKRRSFWAMGQWHRFDAAATEAKSAQDMVAAEQSNQAAQRVLEGLRSQCTALGSTVGAMHGVEAAQQARLQAAQAREEVLEQNTLLLETQLSRQTANEQALCHEQQETQSLRSQLHRLEAMHAQTEKQSSEMLKQAMSSKELLVTSEQSCLKMQADISKKDNWRMDAERHIREMATCGEGLEKERAQLLQNLAESRQESRCFSEELESLREQFEEEGQLGELLKARTWALEQDNATLSRSLQEERSSRLQDAERWGEELRGIRQEEAKVLLKKAEDATRSQLESAEAAQEEMMKAWSKERELWSLHSSDVIAEFEQQLSTTRRDLELTSQAGQAAEMKAARLARDAALAAEMQEAEASAHRAEHAEFTREAELCRQMTMQLEHRLAQAQSFQQQRLTIQEAGLPCSSGIATPQLEELDAYAELVERLQAEVSREHEERQATAQSLEALRGSYRLLLQRTPCSTSPSFV